MDVIITKWSEEDKCYISTTPLSKYLSAFGSTPMESERELEVVVKEVVAWMKEGDMT